MAKIDISEKNRIFEIKYKGYFDKIKTYYMQFLYLIPIWIFFIYLFSSKPDFDFMFPILIMGYILNNIVILIYLIFLPKEKIVLTNNGFIFSDFTIFTYFSIYKKSSWNPIKIKNNSYNKISDVIANNNFLIIKLNTNQKIKIRNLSLNEITQLKNKLNEKKNYL